MCEWDYGVERWVRRLGRTDSVPFSGVLGEVGPEKGDKNIC